jgi:hypothetical protein
VAAIIGDGSLAAAAINVAISCSVYGYGIARVERDGRSRAGGTSQAGSSVCRWRANWRTTDSRAPQYDGSALAGCVAHATAPSIVTVRASVRSR